MASSRKYLGAEVGYGMRLRVYLRNDAIEVEEASINEIERRRVYFDDILLLTYHRERGKTALIIMGIILVMLGLTMAVELSSRTPEAAIGSGFWFIILFIIFTVRLTLGVDVITVYGRRTMARLKFFWRKGRARRIYQELAQKIEAHQVRAAKAQAAAAPKPPPPPAEPPLPPSLGSMDLPPPPPPGPA